MIRYEIDDYRGSGTEALFLLSALEIARSIEQKRADLRQRLALITELNAHELTVYPDRAGTNRPKPDFGEYFSTPGSDGLVDFKMRTRVCKFFVDFLIHHLEQLPEASLRLNVSTEKQEDVEAILDKQTRGLHQAICRSDVMRTPHPTYSWRSSRLGDYFSVPAFSIPSIQLALGGFSSKFMTDNPEAGVFYVLREARGVSSRSSDHLNLIVRELLWIRYTEKRWRDHRSNMDGFYFSPVDSTVYAITETTVVDGGQLQLFGRKLLPNGLDLHHFYLSMPTARGLPQANLHRPGLVCGSTSRARFPAAWKVAVLQPPSSEPLWRALEVILAQDVILRGKGVNQLKEQRSEFQRAMAALDYLQTRGHVGLLSSHKLATKSKQSRNQLKDLRLGLKSLLQSTAGPKIDDITKELFLDLLSKAALSAIQLLQDDESTKRRFNKALHGILASWRMLDNVSIFAPAAIIDEGDGTQPSINESYIARLVEAPVAQPHVDIDD